jgi:membrane-bound lytic murein transglycosylase F
LKNLLKALLLLVLIALVAWSPFALYDAMRTKAAEIEATRTRARNALPALRVGVMQHPTVYFIDANDQPAGLEYDLVGAFAVTQRSEVEWIVFRTPTAAREALARGELDLVAVGDARITSNNGNPPHSPATEIATQTKYHQSAWVLLHTPNKFQPKSFAELLPKRVVVSSRVFSHPRFETIAKQYPKIEFVVDTRNDDETLMAAVGDDEVPYAIVEEDTFNSAKHFHYDTQRAFIVHPPLQRRCAMRPIAFSRASCVKGRSREC